ncbi:mannose-6-phosphate isomerase ManA [Thermoclostridium stercorarium subsp. stercorarium DSM 8532]|jgi:mannose-6-phosphate isomerase|uniref:Phosphohexomutase n=3 Tax=Thermoclostridium stercorarium TaxID=1510 RepID=L7VJF4_THES1|nr:type I phosphomannose isomerase catalytic subunit [Thermoclostridium stercorarium]AGC68200.1 mannose-6-phosphate isomerase ManA [Thermoclostridium stercorarium subsp. stercorarium DSM 8532]AGI39228.1 mannose-6-phosphate isomerase [Thermoclostridium stercorarium subsp. stercorarium DSM 8532]ANW99998.1 mannose-6-phosphate isomerase [Thermoclostridium stercorarium subsp. thermolacticum DSM 2910]ANX02644.1 mannose-6-phosphate isomerase [Thermoclostridium stercorarium subsp. leptospartum DSM 9219
MLYPLKFHPVYKDYIWGGRNLSKFGKQLPEGKVAESWELACHPDGMSVVRNGIYEGRTLKSMIEEFGGDIVGELGAESAGFPLLIKLIDANDRLSVQVHPDDEFAKAHEGDNGKNEMWYILDAKPGAKLVYGLKKGITKSDFEKAVRENRIEDCLNYINVKAGDFINIPAGLIHAIGDGIILAEIQQSSNVTYRVYDYNRRDAHGNLRPLHIEKAMQVINFNAGDIKYPYEGLEYKRSDNVSLKVLVANKHFCVELYKISGNITQETNFRKFHAYICIAGSGEIGYQNERVSIGQGETVLIPACIGEYRIKGKLTLLKTYVPDLDADIYGKLMEMGYKKEEIKEKIAGLDWQKPNN